MPSSYNNAPVLFSQAMAAIPQPAISVPPPVDTSGEVGTAVTRYALENHTHKSFVQTARLAVSGGAGQATWTFAVPYPSGMIPVCVGTAETTALATQPFVVNLIGQPTNTSATFLVFRAQTVTLGGTLLAIAGSILNVFGLAPNSTYINVIARLPTQ